MPFFLLCVNIFELRTVSFGKDGFGVFFQFPIGNFAFFASSAHPFVADPTGSAAVFGIANHKCFSAMGGDFGEFAFIRNGTDPVKGAVARRPKFDFFQQAEKIDVFSVIAFVAFCGHNINSEVIFLKIIVPQIPYSVKSRHQRYHII